MSLQKRPFLNEHSARLRDPEDFDKETFRRKDGGTIYGSKKVPKTISIMWAKLKGKAKPKDNPIPQSLRFPIKNYTVAKAKKWLKDNGIKFIKFEAAAPAKKTQAEKFNCECIDCGHTMESDEHCSELECPECGGEMRRKERPGPGRGVDNIETRGLLMDTEVRSIDKETRTVTFIAATENGVKTIFGTEHLRMAGVRLARYRKNPVVLDSHNREEIGAIIGRGSVKVEGRMLAISITFAETERAETAWQLVESGFARAVSVGFIPNSLKTITLAEGETDGKDENLITGPARVIKEWELFEVSVVPVPADAGALRRVLGAENTQGSSGMVREIIDGLIDRIITKKEERRMEDDRQYQEGEQGKDGQENQEGQENRNEGDPNISDPTEQEILARDIRALAPRGMEKMADQCILDKLTVEEARKRMLDEYAKQTKAVGTPEPEIDQKAEKKEKIDDLDDDALVRALS